MQDSLDGIKVTGKKLSKPKVSVKAPFVIDKTRTEVLSKGSGPAASASGIVKVNYYGVNGRTGKKFDESYSTGTPVVFSLTGVVAGFQKGLTGQRAGSRVLIAMPGSDGYDAAGGQESADIKVGDTLIFVVDIIDVSLSEPAGKTMKPAASLPKVAGGAADKPTVTIPATDPPSKMSATVLIEGTRAKISKTDTIMARYVGYSWKTGKLIDDGWTEPTGGALTGLIPGWQTGLVGKKVGSRVLLVLPPKDGFPEGSNNPPVEAGDTVVYVIDLLFATAGTAS